MNGSNGEFHLGRYVLKWRDKGVPHLSVVLISKSYRGFSFFGVKKDESLSLNILTWLCVLVSLSCMPHGDMTVTWQRWNTSFFCFKPIKIQQTCQQLVAEITAWALALPNQESRETTTNYVEQNFWLCVWRRSIVSVEKPNILPKGKKSLSCLLYYRSINLLVQVRAKCTAFIKVGVYFIKSRWCKSWSL